GRAAVEPPGVVGGPRGSPRPGPAPPVSDQKLIYFWLHFSPSSAIIVPFLPQTGVAGLPEKNRAGAGHVPAFYVHPSGGTMTSLAEWSLERYRPLLRLQVRQFQLDPRLHRRFDSSDLVQETLLRAHAGRNRFRGTTE